MTNRHEYKEALGRIDKDIRICIKYLEGLTEERFKLAMKAKQPQQPQVPKVDFSRLESKDDSLQKQIDGLRKKTDIAYEFTKEYDNAEIFLNNLVKKADQVLGEISQLFEELYASGFFRKEGKRRKIRDEGLIKNRREGRARN